MTITLQRSKVGSRLLSRVHLTATILMESLRGTKMSVGKRSRRAMRVRRHYWSSLRKQTYQMTASLGFGLTTALAIPEYQWRSFLGSWPFDFSAKMTAQSSVPLKRHFV